MTRDSHQADLDTGSYNYIYSYTSMKWFMLYFMNTHDKVISETAICQSMFFAYHSKGFQETCYPTVKTKKL